MDEIRVNVVKRKGANLYLRYVDPVTGKRREKNSGTKSQKKANKAAGEWQAELSSGVDSHGTVVRWADFRDRYEDECVCHMRDSTAITVMGIFNNFERVMSPDKLSRVTTQWISRFQKLRLDEVVTTTIDGDCRVLKAALNWAKLQGFISAVPTFPKLKKARKVKVMKGRPVTAEEFDRMLDAVIKVANLEVDSGRFLLRGLWVSGLRLGEAMGLTWDTWADGIRVDMSGESTVLLISAEDEKGGQDREYAVAPEFDEFLRAVPEEDRTGHVFNVMLSGRVCRNTNTVSKKLVAVGKAAGVKVDERTVKDRKTKKAVKKIVWGSAHDLRRAFGLRWARLVMPMVLKELMRHKTVLTTEKYYVGIQAQETATHLRQVMAAELERQKPKKVNGEVNEAETDSADTHEIQ
ncbi:MAG: site-specific integrase [Planctomycetaceae bacterium]